MLTKKEILCYRKLLKDQEIEAIVGKILGEYKAIVSFKIIPYDYKDVKFKFINYCDINGKVSANVKIFKMDAGISRTKIVNGKKMPDPYYMYWIDVLIEIFSPIRKYLKMKDEIHRNKIKTEI